MGGDFEALQAHFDALNSERSTVEAAAWRKLEAQCGFDVDSGPEQMIEALLQLLKDYPGTGVNEAALATQGLDTATVLQEEIEIASQVGIECNFSDVLKVAKVSTSFEQPAWVEAEEASDKVRAAFDLGTGPVSSMKLAEVMHATPKSIVGSGSNASGVPKFGLRCGKRREDWQRITLQSRRTEARRFEMARALGDVLGYAAETLGPLTSLRTHRQQFQRAFAQALLCPFEGLMTYINTEQPRAEDVEAAARHFKVGEAVVLTVLVNKDVISRQRFEQMRADRSIGLYG